MDPFKYINSLSLFGTDAGYKPGLARIKRLLHYLGNPHHNLKIIHLAGTNGKGSTAAILERIYREAGYKTALYSSPHYFHFNERIKINGRACSTYELAEIVQEVEAAAEKLKSENYAEPSFFEVVTAIAFKYFKQHEPDIVILETGLGGRLDATNVIKKSLLSIITNISLEHRKFLGNTAAEIAAEKAGIIKQNSKVLTAVEQKEALKVIRAKAAAQNSKFMDLKEEYQLIKAEGNLQKNNLSLKKFGKKENKYKLSLLGEHQAVNAALALRAVEELTAEFPLKQKDIRAALADIYWPGRMEKIAEKPLIFLDGAHNPAAFKELAKNINNSSDEFKNLHLVFSVLKDKDLNAILEELTVFKTRVKFYLAENNSFRTISLNNLVKAVKVGKFEHRSFSSVADASSKALANAELDDLIIAAGSFNTVFEAGIEFMSKMIRGGENE
ncbi:dihydrofolate synthase/folylpolyglutamate synthase [Halanaerobium saccharolyticum]|uniref:tetrahydrofolate synthase n=1 Tax=Halanaerobium saccharolyticum TaxID=43595 RepID=A0A4R7ZCD9_9FIRM|nr:folylpolyglutamate synthase/dihydrofolate synthase family protein [Halanaerobium saccharolyticum]RAK09377.1 dihydrofolate synthase/folylpolyglutamate synthase [Halanaerobium saccharolyticum]TDW06236.1 dihydrofolate synthase/folylpolyglutamate synthase [Halanaerobium saccharolyticum]TDX61030.1 dihydrofolate synthase/folylpolyglutamate synthase [Halanaerobium saccharolyticum]